MITPVGALGWKGEDLVINGGKPGEIARRLFDAITGIQYGRAPDHARLDDLDRRLSPTACPTSWFACTTCRRWRPVEAALAGQGIGLRRALPGDRPVVTALARAHGSEGWAAECDAAFARLPLACFIAVARDAADPRGRPRRCSASPATTPPAAASSVPSWFTPIGASAASDARCCSPRCTRCVRKGTPTRSSAGPRRSSSIKRPSARR